MIEVLQAYAPTIWGFLYIGGLLLVQLLVADVVGLTGGHTPGSAVTTSHESFHFRATRAHANTNESVASYLLLSLSGIGVGVEPQWLNLLSLAYCISRTFHMCFYWIGWGTLRSLSFIVSLLALFGLLVAGVVSAF